MEKPAKPKAKKAAKNLLKAATFSLPARPANPSTSRGFSGPISIVPAAARHRRPPHSDSIDLDAILPRSPEVSCLGRVRSRMGRSSDELRAPSPPCDKKGKGKGMGKGRASVLGRLLSRKGSRKERKEEEEEEEEEKAAAAASAPGPCLGELRRFSSSRGTLAGFDWRAHVGAAVEPVEGAGGDGEEEGDEGNEEKDGGKGK